MEEARQIIAQQTFDRGQFRIGHRQIASQVAVDDKRVQRGATSSSGGLFWISTMAVGARHNASFARPHTANVRRTSAE
jgi:hypothetical protein